MASKKTTQYKKKSDFGLDTSTPDCPPPISCGTSKINKPTKEQKEILILIQNEYNNYTQISRHLHISPNAVKSRCQFVAKKGYLKKSGSFYHLTKKALTYLKEVEVSPEVFRQKSQHSNEFTVKLNKLPTQWNKGNFFFQSLKAKEFFNNETTKTTFFKFEECSIRICYGKAKKVIFNINKQYGRSFDEIESNVWDLFVKYFNIINSNGFDLNTDVTSKNPHFANPEGFFAKLSQNFTQKGFRIDTDKYSFWVDYSEGVAEEETDSLEFAKRIEDLSNSAINTNINFEDMELMRVNLFKVSEIVTQLVIIQSKQLIPQETNLTDLKRVDYFG